MHDLSIVIPTRNRISDLTLCIESIGAQSGLENVSIELLIVDDGEIEERVLEYFREVLGRLPDASLRYYRKTKPGVWLSRYEALGLIDGEILLSFDDDAELDDPLYIRRLLDTYASDPSIAGVGGIAKGLSSSKSGKLLGRLTCQMSASPGRLSASTLAGSLLLWGETENIFETDFFHGCNMSFRSSALRDMKPYPWMTSYAVADDIYMCHLASRYGKLVINPELKIMHHESPSSRDKAGRVARATAVNHYYLLNLRKAPVKNYAALLWTLSYLAVKSTLKRNFNAVSGYASGILFILNPRKNKYREFMLD
ncbi:family 2 glycosyl transferase [Paenibacillus sp. FSL R7-277]|uniref:glycosyltransferase family 2 protein n=1 Tax=Paenibacillus sp. FSL R7-277 TaxID=1227352 RepID=UPI0003E253D8|nr:glycosyltransferase family 2 protein [Paenibacillus sp. FSL R7-277]ETT65281.1 family 2 glycosyl transferase [Paenibacillus sp. FSL R7-277]